jgi:uncharacterized protein (DUF1697 family)
MALVVFLRGVNVGGHRAFRPTILAKELRRFDVVSIGAAGTFVCRSTTGPATLRAEMMRRLPFRTELMICRGKDMLRLASGDPFQDQPSGPHVVRFVSVLAQRQPSSPPVPLDLPSDGRWCVRILAHKGRFVLGVYRREMKAIRYLGQLEKVFGVPATTRNWTTILAIVRVLKD